MAALAHRALEHARVVEELHGHGQLAARVRAAQQRRLQRDEEVLRRLHEEPREEGPVDVLDADQPQERVRLLVQRLAKVDRDGVAHLTRRRAQAQQLLVGEAAKDALTALGVRPRGGESAEHLEERDGLARARDGGRVTGVRDDVHAHAQELTEHPCPTLRALDSPPRRPQQRHRVCPRARGVPLSTPPT